MLRRVGADAAQCIEQGRGNALRRVVVRAAVDNAVAHRSHRQETDVLVQPIDQKICRRMVIEVADDAAGVLIAGGIVKRQRGTGKADAVDFSV